MHDGAVHECSPPECAHASWRVGILAPCVVFPRRDIMRPSHGPPFETRAFRCRICLEHPVTAFTNPSLEAAHRPWTADPCTVICPHFLWILWGQPCARRGAIT